MTALLRPALCAVLVFLAACAEMPSRSVTEVPDDILRFPTTTRPMGVAQPNADLAQDFLDLTFQLENGDRLRRLLKYQGPVRIALRSPGLGTYEPELSGLVTRIRDEAQIDIALTQDKSVAQIHLWAVSRASISRVFPGAACFIVPGVTSWEEFRNPPAGRRATLWSELEALTVTSIFIPSDSTPQDTRDCLHEEIGQALGPANDLYRLPNTVFNDDNFHSVLTPFDMLMLRVLYDAELPAGISRREATPIVMSILDRVNPIGREIPLSRRAPASDAWNTAIEDALNRRRHPRQRKASALRAVALAEAMSPQDHRLGLSYLTLGRIVASKNIGAAKVYFERAYSAYAKDFDASDVHLAHVSLHLALTALKQGDLEFAAELARRHAPAARAAENAVVLSGLLAVESEARLASGQVEDARQARIDSLAWARYAFGDTDGTIARAQAQIAAYRPHPRGVR